MTDNLKIENCVFCGIVSGEVKTPGVFWDDEKFMAFLSIFPSVEGFAIVIPKKHFGSDVLAMPDRDLADFILAAKKVSNILLKYFDDTGRIGLMMEGTGINHAHIKLVPMHGTEHMKRGEWKQIPSNRHDFYEKYEGWLASHDGPRASDDEIEKLAEKLRMI